MRAMTIFIAIAALGFFHVISSEVTEWCFAVWFVGMVAYSQLSDPLKNATLFEERAEPDLIPPCGLGGYVADSEYVSSPPQGGDATIPVDSAEIDIKQWARQAREITGGRQRNTALLALMKTIEQELGKRMESPEVEEKSDNKYDDPQASYPEMMME